MSVAVPVLLFLTVLFGTLGIFVADVFFVATLAAVLLALATTGFAPRRR